MHDDPSKNSFYLVALVLSLTVALGFVSAYVSAEHPAYAADFGSYWYQFKFFGQAFMESWPEALALLRSEIQSADYNSSAQIPLLPFYWALGGERVVYISAVVAIYLFPAAYIATQIAREGRTLAGPPAALTLFAALSFTPFWAPTLRGYVDIAGLVPLGLAALLLLKTDFLTRADRKTAICFGLLLWCPFLFRRWYAFSIIALLLITFLVVAIKNSQRAKPFWKISNDIVLNYGFAGSSALLAAIIFQPNLITRVYQTSYSDAYAGFQKDLPTQIQVYYDHIGLWVLSVALIGLASDFAKKRRTSFFCASIAILTAFLFSRVQAPWTHHILPVAFFLFPAYVAGVAFMAKYVRSQPIVTSALCAMMGLNFFSSFVPVTWGPAEPVRIAFPRERHPPLRLAQYEEYLRLVDDLKGLEPQSTIAVYASSMALNHWLVAALDPTLSRRIMSMAHVDKSEGFKWSVLSADYALVGSPVQLQLNPGTQRVIELPAQDILAGAGIGAAFVDTGRSYHLDDGARARLFKRTRPLTVAEIGQLANRFNEYYPEWKTNRALGTGLAFAVINPGDSKAFTYQASDKAIVLRPGQTQPTIITFRMNEWFRPSKLKTSLMDLKSAPCSAEANIRFEFAGEGAAATTLVVKGGDAVETLAPTGDELKITIFPAPQPHCELGVINFEFASYRE